MSAPPHKKTARKKSIETRSSPKQEINEEQEAEIKNAEIPKHSTETLQGLLSRLGAHEDFVPNPSLGRSRLNTLLAGIKSEDEAGQLQSLMELCDYLSIGTEENLANFSLDQFVPALTNLLSMEHNPDIMLLACRSLAYLLEALPGSGATLVSHQTIPILCAKLLNIEYIDLAEQALQCLEKLSYEYGNSILNAGGMMAVLSFLDFFATGTQRIAVTIAANMCRNVQEDRFSQVSECIPNLTNLLQYQDQKLVEKVILCFARLSESFSSKQQLLEELCKYGLLENLIRLISQQNTPTPVLSNSAYILSLGLMSRLCSGSAILAIKLLQEGISAVLQAGFSTSNSTIQSPNASSDQLYELLSLTNELLPPLPKDVTIYITTGSSYSNILRRAPRKSKKDISKDSTMEIDEEPEDARITIPSKYPNLWLEFSQAVLLRVISIYGSTVNTNVRYLALSITTKIFYFCSPEMLKDLLRSLSVSSFIASLLSSADINIVATALQMCQILMQKLPEIFDIFFRREGVVFEIRRLCNEKTEMGELNEQQQLVKQWIKVTAQKLNKGYFGDKMDIDEESLSQGLKYLKELASKLHQYSLKNVSEQENITLLKEIRDLLAPEEGMSTFEFLRSKIINTLYSFLVSRDDKTGTVDGKTALDHGKEFCSVFLNPANGEESVQSTTTFLRKLQDTMNKQEKLPILQTELTGTLTGLKYLTQPFKLKLNKAEEKNAQESKESEGEGENQVEAIVLVEPLASITAIKDFLVSRVFKDTSVKPMGTIDSEENVDDMSEDEDEEQTFGAEPQEITPGTQQQSSTSAEKKEHTIELYLDGIKLPEKGSVFSALQSVLRKQDEGIPIQKLWERVHSLQYVVASDKMEMEAPKASIRSYGVLENEYQWVIEDIGQRTMNEKIFGDTVPEILGLMSILYKLNSLWPQLVPNNVASGRIILPPQEFINNKVTAKIMKQLADPLNICSGGVPQWCAEILKTYSFLLPFEVRKLYFISISFGIARALQSLVNYLGKTTGTRANDLKVGRIQRQKVRISRSNIFESAVKVMELYGSSKAILEVEYFAEVGTGLGPTLEFYTLVSQEFLRRDFQMWKDIPSQQKEDVNVVAPHGLFPEPIQPSEYDSEAVKVIIQKFKFMGKFVAKSLLDNRLLDLPLSIPFLKWMVGKRLTFADLKEIDPGLALSLEKMYEICKQKKIIELNPNFSDSQKKSLIENLKLGDCLISDLDLDFTLSGRPNWELKPKGSSISVDIHNLEEYISLVLDQHIKTGVAVQLGAFKEGFDEVFPMDNLSIFTVEELETLICGTQESNWDIQTLIENTHCDHGYTHNSKTVQNLLEIMSEMTPEEQRKFLLFVTGSPKLPFGGFKALEPKLTIVRREGGSQDPDQYLPSVNCCFYYLKLPDYSSKEVLKEKLMFAIENGQGSFSFN